MKAPLISTSLMGAGLLLAANAFADAPGAHPAYLHARSDLRRAELLMHGREEPNVVRDLGEAAREAHEAIREIDAAAAWDRKDLIDNPPVDTYPDRPGKFRAIAQFLFAPRHDIEREKTIRRRARGATGRCITSMNRSA